MLTLALVASIHEVTCLVSHSVCCISYLGLKQTADVMFPPVQWYVVVVVFFFNQGHLDF